MAEDRERIAIESLARLGRIEQAQARNARFRGRYPNSPYRRRLDLVLSGDAGEP